MNNLDETNGDFVTDSSGDNPTTTDDDDQQPNSADETSTTEEVNPADVSDDDVEYEYNSEKMGMTPVVRSSDNESSESAESADDGDSGNAD